MNTKKLNRYLISPDERARLAKRKVIPEPVRHSQQQAQAPTLEADGTVLLQPKRPN
jgi:hypothetical protein